MSTSPVSRFSEDEVGLRLGMYNRAGAFEADLKRLWGLCGPAITEALQEHWTGIVPMIRSTPGPFQQLTVADFVGGAVALFTGKIDADWVREQAEVAIAIHATGMPAAFMMDGSAQINLLVNRKIREALADDLPNLHWAIDTVLRYYYYTTEIMIAQLAKLDAQRVASSRTSSSSEFEQEVAELIEGSVVTSAALRRQTGAASSSARGMLDKTSEVAAAAEESAYAMREAAQTAAGLIRAIEEARFEVERAGDVARRASDQANDAAGTSRELSEQVEAIESILGLIRDIAGQTNLLALNATIEAARAGDAGRGFAVVAQEVKSLASQTARATDDIAKKIAGIQAATRSTVEVNGQIIATIADVQETAARVQSAMDAQSQTVTLITSAVDETAMAADSMSSTINVIRGEAESFRNDLDEVGVGFGELDDRLRIFAESTSTFLRRMAA